MSEDSHSRKSSASSDREESADEARPPAAKYSRGENMHTAKDKAVDSSNAGLRKSPHSSIYTEKDRKLEEKKDRSSRDNRHDRDGNKNHSHRSRDSHGKDRRSRSQDRSSHSRGKGARNSPHGRGRDRRTRGKGSPNRKRTRQSRSRSPPSHSYTSSRHSDSGSSRSSRDSHRRSRSRDRDRMQGSSTRSRSKEHDRSDRHRSRSKERQRSRSRERRRGGYEKKPNKLTILERLGIELRPPDTCPNVTPQQLLQRSMEQQAAQVKTNTGIELPKYYNPAAMNPSRYAEQMQKRRLLWGNKALHQQQQQQLLQQQGSSGGSVDPKPQMSNNKWEGTTFAQDQDGKMTAKFKRLMGIKDSGQGAAGNSSTSTDGNEMLKKQEELFNSMEMQYEVARVATHTHRGVGLGFGTFQYPR